MLHTKLHCSRFHKLFIRFNKSWTIFSTSEGPTFEGQVYFDILMIFEEEVKHFKLMASALVEVKFIRTKQKGKNLCRCLSIVCWYWTVLYGLVCMPFRRIDFLCQHFSVFMFIPTRVKSYNKKCSAISKIISINETHNNM